MSAMGGVNLGCTKAGNVYQKSNIGRKIGTAVGAVAVTRGLIAGNQTAKAMGHGGLVPLFKKFIQNGPTLGDKLSAIARDAAKNSQFRTKAVDLLAKSKGARIGAVAAGVALAVGVGIGMYRLIGRGVDALINKGAKNEADRRASMEA